MTINFDEFDKMVDLEGLKADIQEAANRVPGEYVDVPSGTYEVKLTKLELGASKTDKPMVKMFFKILEGEYANQTIFMNQIVTQGFQIGIVNDLLRNMGSEKDITFESFTAYKKLLTEVFEELKGKYEFSLDYGENSKGFKTYKILKVFPAIH